MLKRLKGLFRSKAIDQDMDKEMRFHVEMLAQEYERSGMSAEEARAAALRRFGNLTQLKERGLDVRGGGVLEELRQDLSFGIRMLRRSPGFTVVAVLALGLGIGVNTAIFNLANGMFFRSQESGSGTLVRMYGMTTNEDGRAFDSFSFANYKDVRDRSQSFAGLAAHQAVSTSVDVQGAESFEVQSELVSGNYFSVVSLSPRFGRLFGAADDNIESPAAVVVVSERFVRGRMGLDLNVVGKTVYVNGHPFEIIGVVDEKFSGTFGAFQTEMWFPIASMAQVRPRGIPLTNRGWGWLFGTGRLKPGVSVAQADDEVRRIAKGLETEFPRQNRGFSMQVVEAGNLPDEFQANASRFILFFMCAAVAVLLITCSNIASMMLARAAARGREVAIRQSLGAGRWRLVRQWLTESVLLALLGGSAGIAFAFWLKQSLLKFTPPEWSNFAPDLTMDWRVALFAMALVVSAGILFGVAPAMRAGGASLLPALKSDGVNGSKRSRFYGLVVAVQVTLSLMLMIVSGLLFRSLQQTEAFRPGFDSDHIVVGEFDLRRNGYTAAQRAAFLSRFTELMKASPDVAGVSYGTVAPLGTSRESGGYQIEGYTPPNGRTMAVVANDAVGPDYFATMGIPLVKGRTFDAGLPPGPPSEAVVNEAFVSRYWQGQEPIGKTLTYEKTQLRVVGVAKTIAYYELGESPRPYIYVSIPGNVPATLMLLVRTSGDAGALSVRVKQAVRDIDSKLALNRIVTFTEMRRLPLFPMRALLAVAGGFGALALTLTLIGLYGVISYSVTRRTREFGIRIALGAERARVFRMVVGEGLRLAGVGIVAGLLGAIAGTQYMSSLLFGVKATDPLTYVVICSLMILTSALACYLPARRATRVDPIIALRQDG